MDKRLLKILKTEFDIRNEDIFSIAGPLDLTVLMKVYGLEALKNINPASMYLHRFLSSDRQKYFLK